MTDFWRCLAVALIAGAAWSTATASATELQPLDSIIEIASKAAAARAAEHGYENVRVETRPLDSRLRLPLCDRPLESLSPRSGAVLGATSTGVRCAGSTPWTLYVRLETTAMRSVPVLARSLPRYALITAQDLKMVERPLASVPKGILFDTQHIVGMELSRAMDEGSVIRTSQVRVPKVVKRGDQVTLVSGSGGLSVSSQGKALGDARPGERVTVVNSISGVKVEGVASTDGTVTVQ